MTYVLIKNNKVIQKRPDYQQGFIEAPDHVVPGFLYNGSTGEFTAPDTSPSIDEVLEDALQQIDQAAEQARICHAAKLRHSVGATYRKKYAEAQQYQSDGTVGPYLEAEANRKGVTVNSVAQEIVTRAEEWQGTKDALNPQVEAERTGGKTDCRVAYDNGDKAGIETARDNAVAALYAI